MTLPKSAAELAEALGQDVKHKRMGIAVFAEAGPGNGVHGAVTAAIEDSVRLEDGNGVVALDLLQQAEHFVDRTAGRLALFVDSDDQKAPIQEIARRSDRHLVGG